MRRLLDPTRQVPRIAREQTLDGLDGAGIEPAQAREQLLPDADALSSREHLEEERHEPLAEPRRGELERRRETDAIAQHRDPQHTGEVTGHICGACPAQVQRGLVGKHGRLADERAVDAGTPRLLHDGADLGHGRRRDGVGVDVHRTPVTPGRGPCYVTRHVDRRLGRHKRDHEVGVRQRLGQGRNGGDAGGPGGVRRSGAAAREARDDVPPVPRQGGAKGGAHVAGVEDDSRARHGVCRRLASRTP